MPLHAQEEIWVIRLFNRFDNPIRSNCRNYQSRCRNMYTLVMAAVYSNLVPAMADRMKQGIFCNADSVTGDIIIKWLLVSDGKIPFCLGRDILIQVSAKACI